MQLLCKIHTIWNLKFELGNMSMNKNHEIWSTSDYQY